MVTRHWIALASLAAAAALLVLRPADTGMTPASARWVWDWGYWFLLLAAGAALWSGRRRGRRTS